MSEIHALYARYFAEKIWEVIPPVYREQDGLGDKPHRLRAFVEVLATHAAHLRKSQDKLWDDEAVDLADDWAIPYIGELVATRMVSALNTRARRVDVAKTIYYRRRKGTPRILEELIADIADWDGKLVEEFKRLARMRHGLDPAPLDYAGRFTGTPPGGLADLRNTRGAALADGPFDEFHYTPDMRRPHGRGGRYGIPKLGFHFYRLQTFRIRGATPVEWPAPGPARRAFSIDPSGRDIPLFMVRHRPEDWDTWTSAKEWELPAPMPCRVLGHAEYMLTKNEVDWVRNSSPLPLAIRTAAADQLTPWIDVPFVDENTLRTVIGTLPNGINILGPTVFPHLLEAALIADCGKAVLLPDPPDVHQGVVRVVGTPGGTVPRNVTNAGNLDGWPPMIPPPADKQMVIDPERARLLFIAPAANVQIAVDYVYGFSAEMAAGPYPRAKQLAAPVALTMAGGLLAAMPPNAISQFDDNATYAGPANIAGITTCVIQAKDSTRPFIRLGTSWSLTAPANQDAHLTLDGLWIGGAPATPGLAVVLDGDYEQVTIRSCTFDPGGPNAAMPAQQLAPIRLVVAGHVENMLIDRSIMAPIQVQGTGVIEHLVIKDSIVQSIADAIPPLDLAQTDLRLERATVLWTREDQIGVNVNRLYATDTLANCQLDVTNTQEGCFRFSAGATGSRVPHPYESQFVTDTAHFFTSMRFGDPGFAQLSRTVPDTIFRGAESGAEMGAFSSLINPIKYDSLLAKIEEYMPFGLIPIFLEET